MSKFDELKQLAEAVPELPWEVTGHTVYALEHDSWRKGVEQMRNRFSFSVQRGPNTPESELQAVAEFCKTANPAAVLELLAIQAQMVAVLESVFKIQIENYGDGINTHINLMALTTKVQDALFAAGALP